MHRRRPLALLVPFLLVLASCGITGSDDDAAGPGNGNGTTTEPNGNGNGNGTTTTTTASLPENPDEVDQFLVDAVDATLATSSFTVSSAAELRFGIEQIALTADGSLDYENLVADALIRVESGPQGTEIELRADGTNAWFRLEGTDAPEVPGGLTWIQGDASRLAGAETYQAEGVIGVLLALRGTDGAEAGDVEELDGVETRRYATTVTYAEAVEGAGPDADAFASALSLTGADDAELVMDVWVGEDGVIRRLELTIEASQPISGTYSVEISDVGAEVTAPDRPDEDDVLTGPEAEALLDDIVT